MSFVCIFNRSGEISDITVSLGISWYRRMMWLHEVICDFKGVWGKTSEQSRTDWGKGHVWEVGEVLCYLIQAPTLISRVPAVFMGLLFISTQWDHTKSDKGTLLLIVLCAKPWRHQPRECTISSQFKIQYMFTHKCLDTVNKLAKIIVHFCKTEIVFKLFIFQRFSPFLLW